MSVDVSKAVCQKLMESSTATLTSVLRLHGLKNTFMHGVAPLGPGMKMAGPAFTLRYIPAREDLDEIPMNNLKDVQRVGIEQVPDGAVFVIDARGQVVRSLGLNRAGYLESGLPPALSPTLFARFGNILSFLFALLLLGAAIATRHRSR